MKFTVSALMAASAAAIELDTQEETWDAGMPVPTTTAQVDATMVECFWDEVIGEEICFDMSEPTETYHDSDVSWCQQKFDNIDLDQDGWVSIYDYAEWACGYGMCTSDYSEFSWFYDYDNAEYEGWMTYDDYCHFYADYDTWYGEDDSYTHWCAVKFGNWDADHDGYVTAHDLQAWNCTEYGWCEYDDEQYSWVADYGNADGAMSYNDYCDRHTYEHWCYTEFYSWDANGDGYVSAEELADYQCNEWGWCVDADSEYFSWMEDYHNAYGNMDYWSYCSRHVFECYYTFAEWDQDQDGWVSVSDVADQWCEDGFCTDNYEQYFSFFYEASEGSTWMSYEQYSEYCY